MDLMHINTPSKNGNTDRNGEEGQNISFYQRDPRRPSFAQTDNWNYFPSAGLESHWILLMLQLRVTFRHVTSQIFFQDT